MTGHLIATINKTCQLHSHRIIFNAVGKLPMVIYNTQQFFFTRHMYSF